MLAQYQIYFNRRNIKCNISSLGSRINKNIYLFINRVVKPILILGLFPIANIAVLQYYLDDIRVRYAHRYAFNFRIPKSPLNVLNEYLSGF